MLYVCVKRFDVTSTVGELNRALLGFFLRTRTLATSDHRDDGFMQILHGVDGHLYMKDSTYAQLPRRQRYADRKLRMDSDVYSNVRFLVIFLRLWTNKI